MAQRILLLEDEQAIADTLLYSLRSEGFEVTHVPLVRDALAAFARQDPQPEVHIRGDLSTPYFQVGKVVEIAQRSGILKVGFITKAPRPGSPS